MKYIQLDNFNDNISIVCEDDGSGEVKVFDSLQEATDTLDENCQDGQIIPLDVDVMSELETMKYVIQQMYNSYKDETFNIVHVGDLVCKILGVNATFYPSGKIVENK